MKGRALVFSLILLCAGCATGSRPQAQRELQRDVATPYAGALKTEGTNQPPKAVTVSPAGMSPSTETGSAHGEPAKPIPPDLLFYGYIAVGVILLIYLFVLVRRRIRLHAHPQAHPA